MQSSSRFTYTYRELACSQHMHSTRDEMQLLRSGRCNMDYQFAMLIYLQSHELFDP